MLSTDNTPGTNNDQTPAPEQHNYDHQGRDWAQSEPSRDESARSSARKKITDDSTDDLVSIKLNACKYAKLILETFVEMPPFLMDATTTCTCLCIGYCALVLAHYDSTQSQIPDAVVLRLVTRLCRWVRTSPGKAWSNKYANLARQKVEARINGYSSDPRLQGPDSMNGRDSDGGQKDQERNRHDEYQHRDSQTQTNIPAAAQTQQQDPDILGTHGPSEEHRNVDGYHIEDMLAGHPVDPNEGLPSFDLGAETMFPSMEGFFGGGFLDFMR